MTLISSKKSKISVQFVMHCFVNIVTNTTKQSVWS